MAGVCETFVRTSAAAGHEVICTRSFSAATIVGRSFVSMLFYHFSMHVSFKLDTGHLRIACSAAYVLVILYNGLFVAPVDGSNHRRFHGSFCKLLLRTVRRHAYSYTRTN